MHRQKDSRKRSSYRFRRRRGMSSSSSKSLSGLLETPYAANATPIQITPNTIPPSAPGQPNITPPTAIPSIANAAPIVFALSLSFAFVLSAWHQGHTLPAYGIRSPQLEHLMPATGHSFALYFHCQRRYSNSPFLDATRYMPLLLRTVYSNCPLGNTRTVRTSRLNFA